MFFVIDNSVYDYFLIKRKIKKGEIMGQITADQSQQVMATLMTNCPWSEIDFEKINLQDTVIRDSKGAGQKFARWLESLPVKSSGILHRLYPDENIIVGATTGNETIANSDDIFTGYLDENFELWGTNKPSGVIAKPTPAEVYELYQNANFRDMFGSFDRNINSLCWEQGQIRNFVQEHRGKLHPKGWATFFLFKVEDHEVPFVAFVSLGAGELRVGVGRFGVGGVWGAGGRFRVVVPQLVP